MTAFSLFGGLDIFKIWLIALVCTTTIIEYILFNIIKNTYPPPAQDHCGER